MSSGRKRLTIEYNGVEYVGYKNMAKALGVSYQKARLLYLKSIEPPKEKGKETGFDRDTNRRRKFMRAVAVALDENENNADLEWHDIKAAYREYRGEPLV